LTELLSVEAARELAVRAVRPVGAERVVVTDALGRVLAEDVTARADVPPHANSAMDGYAVRAADATAGAELRVVGEAAAGHPSARALGAGEAIKIMTGAPIPDGADAVVMVESTEAAGERVRLQKAAASGDHVRARGEDVCAGQVVLRAGVAVGAAELGLLASLQRASVRVARRPEVAVLSTGDELRDLDQPLDAGAIAESNSYALAALVREAGGAPRLLPIVRDDPALLRAAIEEARRADLVVSTGGVSVGERDHVKAVLAALGATLSAWRVNMKPGKPVALAQLGATPFYGLPGNPVSAMVAFLLFVRPAIRAALGVTPAIDLARGTALLDAPLKTRSDRRQYLRARVRLDGAALRASLSPRQGSGMLTSMVGINALVVLEAGAHDLPAGAAVVVELVGRL
jgi:molybdopterin molybdotransferase